MPGAVGVLGAAVWRVWGEVKFDVVSSTDSGRDDDRGGRIESGSGDAVAIAVGRGGVVADTGTTSGSRVTGVAGCAGEDG
jgi:hypothetical protein